MVKPSETVGLPPSDTVRWSPQRKASVVEAVRNGVISFDEACRRYQLSTEEFLEWQRAMDANGVGGLSVTRFQSYRELLPRANNGWRAGGGPTKRLGGSA
jgi:hypothetical protein